MPRKQTISYAELRVGVVIAVALIVAMAATIYITREGGLALVWRPVHRLQLPSRRERSQGGRAHTSLWRRGGLGAAGGVLRSRRARARQSDPEPPHRSEGPRDVELARDRGQSRRTGREDAGHRSRPTGRRCHPGSGDHPRRGRRRSDQGHHLRRLDDDERHPRPGPRHPGGRGHARRHFETRRSARQDGSAHRQSGGGVRSPRSDGGDVRKADPRPLRVRQPERALSEHEGVRRENRVGQRDHRSARER